MGHYDECRDGYCGICGQTNGNCEHTKKPKIEWDHSPVAIKEEDRHHFLTKEDMREAKEFMSHFSPVKPRFTKDEQRALSDLIAYAETGAEADYQEDGSEIKETALAFAYEQINKIRKMLREDGGYV